MHLIQHIPYVVFLNVLTLDTPSIKLITQLYNQSSESVINQGGKNGTT